MSAFEFMGGLLTAIWSKVFAVEIINGVTFGGIFLGLIVINLGIWFIHMFFKKES